MGVPSGLPILNLWQGYVGIDVMDFVAAVTLCVFVYTICSDHSSLITNSIVSTRMEVLSEY